MTRFPHHDIKNASLTERKVTYIAVNAESNTMREPRKTAFSLCSVRSGTVISANKVVSGIVFFVPSVRRGCCATVTTNTCL